MKGTQYIRIKAPRYSYDLALERKISVLRGYGGTGKTTLTFLITEMLIGNTSIVDSSSKKLVLPSRISLNSAIREIEEEHDAIVIIDEGIDWMSDGKFKDVVNKSDNYFLFITRDMLEGINYSVHSVYELKTDSNNVHTLSKIYKAKKTSSIVPTKLICEDAKSGFILFKLIDTKNDSVLTSGGNMQLLQKAEEICKLDSDNAVAIFGDGAAFGFRIEQCMNYCETYKIVLCLPESLEFILLHSRIFESDEIVQAILRDPVNSIESSYSSGEQFFTHILVDTMNRMGLRYNKKALLRCFADKCCPRYKPCKSEAKGSEYDKIQDLLDQIPLDLSKIFIDGKLNETYLSENKINVMYYQTLDDISKKKAKSAD